MNNSLNEIVARQQIAERVARASSPRVTSTTPRQRVAQHLRRFADRVDS